MFSLCLFEMRYFQNQIERIKMNSSQLIVAVTQGSVAVNGNNRIATAV